MLGILGLAIVSVNAFYVPTQGESLEVAARERAESALVDLASRMDGANDAAVTADVPLRITRASPPLLAGIILSPARAEGSLAVDAAAGSRLRISHVTDAPPGGVPAGDPMRVEEPGGLMRVYALGNATAAFPLGRLDARVGGAYLDAATYRLEGGAVLVERASGSGVVAPPTLTVATGASGATPLTTVAWRVPLLTGEAAEIAGVGMGRVQLAPGPVAVSGGGQRVHNVTFEVTTDAFAAWTTLLQDAVGSHGTVTVIPQGNDTGTVVATILPPAGTPAGTKAVTFDVSAVRFEATLSARGG